MSSNTEQREEGLLRDVLDELDRERSRRAELEEQIRKLQEENELLKQGDSNTRNASRKEMVAKEVEVEGYKQIVNALTSGKPAIAAAEKNQNSKSLPVHVVRLLEVLPWHPSAKEHISVEESVFEWNVFSNGAWQSHLRFFPTVFKTLRLVQGQRDESSSNDRSPLLLFLASGGSDHVTANRSKNQHRVMTDERVTSLYDPEGGFPFPNDGATWEWVGGWRLVKHENISSAPDNALLTDVEGWRYGTEPRDFMEQKNTQSTPGLRDSANKSADTPMRTIRRRCWVRQRVLKDYLLASEYSRTYLDVLAQNAKISITARKVTSQLAETKVALTEAEGKLSELTNYLQASSMEEASTGGEKKVSSSGSPILTSRSESFPPRKMSEDNTSADESLDDGPIVFGDKTDADIASTDKFDWKKIGSGQLIRKFKNNSPNRNGPPLFRPGKNLFRKVNPTNLGDSMI